MSKRNSTFVVNKKNIMAFELPQLPYAKDALEPHIDAKTMEIHHGKHHNGYTTKLNGALEGTGMESDTIETLLGNLDMNNAALRNNGGGYYNHCLFWEVMSPNGGGTASGALAQAIDAAYGSFEDFKTAFSNAAATQFGSGWAWLCVQQGGKVEVCSSANQDNPLMPGIGCGGTPILGLDVWEHAYYLNYQNRRPDYIDAFFNVINWEKVSELYVQNK
jgi:Fe-Mn family superoxide dismutase